jgi:hypothetical protein
MLPIFIFGGGESAMTPVLKVAFQLSQAAPAT